MDTLLILILASPIIGTVIGGIIGAVIDDYNTISIFAAIGAAIGCIVLLAGVALY